MLSPRNATASTEYSSTENPERKTIQEVCLEQASLHENSSVLNPDKDDGQVSTRCSCTSSSSSSTLFDSNNKCDLESISQEFDPNSDQILFVQDKIQSQQSLWKWLCVYIFLPSLIFKSCQRASIPVLPIFVRSDLKGNDYQIGIVMASIGLGKLLGNLPSGQFVAVWGSHIGLRTSCAILSLAWLWAACSFSIRALLVSSYLEGIGLALWQVARQNLVTEQIGIDQGRGKVQSMLGGLERFSAVLGPSMGGFLAAHFGLRAPFAVKSGLMAFNLFLFWVTHRLDWSSHISSKSRNTNDRINESASNYKDLSKYTKSESYQKQQTSSVSEESPFNHATRQKEKESVHSFGRNMQTVIKNHGKGLRQIAVWAILLPIARETRTFLFPLLAMNLGYGPHAIGLMTSITFAVDTALFPLAGYLTDTYGRKYCGVPGGLLMALSYFLAPIWGKEICSLTVIAVLGGIGNGISGGVLNSVGSDMAPTQHRALFLGTFRIVSDCGILLGPLISGFVTEHLGGTRRAFWVIAALSALSSCYMALVLPETRWNRSDNKAMETSFSPSEQSNHVEDERTSTVSPDVASSTTFLIKPQQRTYGAV